MLLTEAQCLAFCQQSAAAADLAAGRALEARHRLHLDGVPGALLAFLELSRPDLLASPDAFNTLRKVAKSATKPIYAGLTNILSKVFTAAGSSFYYDFADAALADDFGDYLGDTCRAGLDFYAQFRTVWGRASYTGFQGVLLVDLAPPLTSSIGEVDDVPLGLPAPVFCYVPSAKVHDVAVTGHRIEYLILQGQTADGQTEYYCYDDQQCHRVQFVSGVLTYQPALATAHGLGYVPACPITTRQPDPTHPVRRTSALAESLEVADVYLRDFNEHELGKAYHAFPKMWSYGVRCDYQAPLIDANGYEGMQSCNAGRLLYGGAAGATGFAGTYDCPRCKGQGKYIPVGPDKTYILEAPQNGDPAITPPAGYIVPDLTSLQYLGGELTANAARIEKAVIGKEGVTAMQTKVESGNAKALDLAPVYDALNDYGDDAQVAMKFVVDTFGRLRYGGDFRASSVALGRKYHLKSADQLETEYASAKTAGLDSALLYGYLEELVYARYAADPMELERNLLKLELTPAPHLTDKEAQDALIIGEDDLLLKIYLNDFVARFERENGSILEFGSMLSHGAKIDKINNIFAGYIAQKRPAPVAGPPAAAAGTFTVGESVMVRPGMEHMPEHAGLTMTVAQVQGDAYAVKLPDGSVHKWYTGAELMSMSSPNPNPAAPPKAPAMTM